MLKVFYIGYVTQNVAATLGMRVVFEEDVELLEETVVIGYGSVKKSNLTSAVASMDNSSDSCLGVFPKLLLLRKITSSGECLFY